MKRAHDTAGEPGPGGGAAPRLRVAGLGLGTAPIGNLYAEVSDGEARAALERALQLGIRYFDTAPYYGHGLAEWRLGDVLAERRGDEVMVSTKVGRRIETDPTARGPVNDGFAVRGSRAVFDYSRAGILKSFEGSLQRLRAEHVEVLLLHDVGRLTHGDRHPQMLRQALDEALPAMAELRSQGVVRALGIGVNEVAVCREILPRFDLDCIMLAGRYTLFEQADALPLLDEAYRRGVSVIVAGPYNSGLLGDPHAPGDTYDYAPADPATLERARAIYAACARAGVEVGAAALQFPLAHPAVRAVVAGMRNVLEVEDAVSRASRRLPASLWPCLREAGIVVGGAPVPGAEAPR